MTSELSLIEALRGIAGSPAARGLMDDAAVLEFGGEKLVLTLDTLVESVHFLPDDPPSSIAWKLVAVNASDLSAKGAEPVGCLYSHALGDDAWDRAFLDGLAEACAHFRLPLLGGDTVRMPEGAPRSFSLTALGRAAARAPSRTDAKPGERVWVSGTIGDSGLGLAVLSGREAAPEHAEWLTTRYRCPCPETRLGPALAPWVSAMMDVSDGLLIDAQRMADASGAALTISAESVPLSAAFRATTGDDLDARLMAMTAGDDYGLLFTAAPEHTMRIREIAAALDCEVSAIGTVGAGSGLSLHYRDQPVPLPATLGYRH
ncbi:thiamine-phosphate kinase [Novosphingobium mangrovi (ex Huang et al. 2023)]|uniref:Thiamine-monophosphate kinase n=1 Tax=Novosphingobium mangrovi (ex Huang et al. 2023) TaxID=2976432 RepID=A0ABT2I801_9SPHN|nr:thiamine-phosphate kinase [Novosphingobium mangrovi (ex Huang et al. 2023)]MCT2400951.1 thiamine-phosphate kinase [Novosphingobium mangrovi (ex Huang et al. 2023)]